MGIAVEVNHLKKTYKGLDDPAVNDASFSVNEGELFGLIGPDGAGKTSIFRTLATLLLPDGGSASVLGRDAVKQFKELRHIIGYMPQRFSLYPDLSVEENLTFFATIFNKKISENYHLIEKIYGQLEPFKDRRANKLSGGMKQKLALCCALIHKPEILILDEPTTGVDAVSRQEFWDILKELKQYGITILVSTPYMNEAILCDRVALMQKGNILSVDTPQNIIESFKGELYEVHSKEISRLLKDIRNSNLSSSCFTFGDNLHVLLEGGITPKDLQSLMEEKKHLDIGINRIKPNIEDCFIQLLNTNTEAAK